jgi:hypothetical protein
MRAHWLYLRYVVRHKIAVLRSGLALGTPHDTNAVAWFWRLLVHDLSKFRPCEWRPYVAQFYGPSPAELVPLRDGVSIEQIERERREASDARKRAFDRAWLEHIHRNPHHWQYHVLREDSGKTKVLLMSISETDEMVADWLGAGPKAVISMPMHQRILLTVAWYVANREKMQLRQPVRMRVEAQLHRLAEETGVLATSMAEMMARTASESILIPGRS